MNNNDVVLEVRNLTKTFPGVKALDSVQLTLRKGEVHALLGENGSGKSTLMKTIMGIYKQDSGEIILHDKEVNFSSPSDALKHGISMIHQEISLVPALSVSENIWLGREGLYTSMGLISIKKRNEATKKLLDDIGVSIEPTALVETLTVANMQLVELARALSYDSDIIIMDEPTSALAESEIKLLYEIVRDIKAKGKTVVFISHKMDEIFSICDTVTIFRDGHYIVTKAVAETNSDELIKYIVGHEMKEMFPKEEAEIKDVVLKVENLSNGRLFKDISFEVHEGEILGVFGLMGAGRTEIMQSVFGIDNKDSGDIYVKGKKVKINSPENAIAKGLGMITEDRLNRGVIANLSVRENIAVSSLEKYQGKFGLLKKQEEIDDTDGIIKRINVKVSTPKQTIRSLSGGNQQKAIIGRWLLREPNILILDEPTRGIDVGSKAEIHRNISILAQQGMAIIMVSSEIAEIIGMSDRILVVRDGSIVADIRAEDASREMLLKYAFGN